MCTSVCVFVCDKSSVECVAFPQSVLSDWVLVSPTTPPFLAMFVYVCVIMCL